MDSMTEELEFLQKYQDRAQARYAAARILYDTISAQLPTGRTPALSAQYLQAYTDMNDALMSRDWAMDRSLFLQSQQS